MAVGCIDHDGVDSGLNQGVDTLHAVGCHTHSGGHAQAAAAVLAGVGFVLGFCDILIGDEAHETAVVVNYGEFFNLVLLEYLGGLFEVGRLAGGNEVFAGHHFVDRAVEVGLEA